MLCVWCRSWPRRKRSLRRKRVSGRRKAKSRSFDRCSGSGRSRRPECINVTQANLRCVGPARVFRTSPLPAERVTAMRCRNLKLCALIGLTAKQSRRQWQLAVTVPALASQPGSRCCPASGRSGQVLCQCSAEIQAANSEVRSRLCPAAPRYSTERQGQPLANARMAMLAATRKLLKGPRRPGLAGQGVLKQHPGWGLPGRGAQAAAAACWKAGAGPRNGPGSGSKLRKKPASASGNFQ